MTQICAAVIGGALALCQPAYEPERVTAGFLSQYAEGPTVGTLAYRRDVGDLPHAEVVGYVAVADCSLIGQEAWVSVNGGSWLPVLVFDCAADDGTPEWMTENGIIGELDFYLTRDLGLLDRGGVPGRIVYQRPLAVGPAVV